MSLTNIRIPHQKKNGTPQGRFLVLVLVLTEWGLELLGMARKLINKLLNNIYVSLARLKWAVPQQD